MMVKSQCFSFQCYNKVCESLRAAMHNQCQCKLMEAIKILKIYKNKIECNVMLQCQMCLCVSCVQKPHY